MIASRILQDKGGAVFSVSPDASLEDAAREITARKVGAVVVLDVAGDPVGVFSERDLARRIAESGAQALAEPVSSCMSRTLITAPAEANVDDLMRLMTERRVRHILITGAGGLEGVVSIGDVVKRKIAAAEAEAKALKDYIAAG